MNFESSTPQEEDDEERVIDNEALAREGKADTFDPNKLFPGEIIRMVTESDGVYIIRCDKKTGRLTIYKETAEASELLEVGKPIKKGEPFVYNQNTYRTSPVKSFILI